MVNLHRKAKNVILFLGDGMSITTLTAARILKGQLARESGEEGSLFFEKFPRVALIKVRFMTHFVKTCQKRNTFNSSIDI